METARHFHKMPHTQAVSEDVNNFLTNYVQENTVLLPGRIPGFKNDNIKLLSSRDTKISVWCEFKKDCDESDKQLVCFSKFTKLWKQFHPNVTVAQPMSDLCLTCQQNTCKLVQPSRKQKKVSASRPSKSSWTAFKWKESFTKNFPQRGNPL